MDAHGSHNPLIEDVLDAGNDLRDELQAKLAAAEERVRELEARWTEAWCPNCHAVIEQCPYCGYDTAPDCFVRDRARLTAPKEDR